jgi:plastocyanin
MVAGTTAFAFTQGAEAAAHLLPSRFVTIDFALNPAALLEDDDAAGRWERVEVVAASKGWKLDQTILESLLQFTQVKGGYDAWISRFAPPQGLREALGDPLVTEAVNGTINTHAKGSGVFTIPPRETRPIDITEEPYSTATVHFALQQEGRQGYRLNPSWEGELRGEVEVRTTHGMFGGNHIYARKDVAIDPVRIVIDPASVTVAPGEIVRFTVTVHAKDKRVSVHADNGSTIHQPQPDGTHLIIYEAPADEAELPDILTVTSESMGGFLANQARRPKATAFIRSQQPSVEIEPRGACVKPGQKQTFTARVDNLEDTRVTWAVDHGTVTQAGVYTAPGGAGAATLTATSVSDPSIFDSITIGVGPCNCVWSLQVGGRGGMSLLGRDIHIGVREGALDVFQFLGPFDLGRGGSMVVFEVDGAFAPFQRGTFPGRASGNHLDIRLHDTADEFDSFGDLPMTLSRFEPVGEHFEVEGRLDGTIYWERVGDEGPEKERDWPGHLSLTFRGTMERLGVPGFEDPDNFSLWCNPF